MQNITITNCRVTIINSEDAVSKAKDKLLSKLYHARNKDTMGGYDKWIELLDMYYLGKYEEMYEYIKSCTGDGGSTRSKCLKYLETIMEGLK